MLSRYAAVVLGMVVTASGGLAAQEQRPPDLSLAPVQRLGPDLLRVGNIQVDTAKKEVSVRGVVNEVQVLEFLANTKGGLKAYESALELDTNAVNFNLALILIGLDPARAVPPRSKFDPVPPQGDPVAVWVEWNDGGRRRRISAAQILYHKDSGATVAEGPWIYTGSVFYGDTGSSTSYAAELDGTLIGFMHTPSSIIDTASPILGDWGSTIINPSLNLKPGTEIVLIVQTLPRGKS